MHFQNRKDSDTHMHTANTIKTIIKRTKKDLKFYKYDNGNPRIRNANGFDMFINCY